MNDENIFEKEDYRGYKIKLIQDDNALNPRTDWDNWTHMICFHPRYDLGDKHEMTVEELKEIVKRKDVIALPLYILDHSGLWMRTGRFAEDYGGWDTSMVGYIYCTFEEIRKNMGRPKHTEKNPNAFVGINHIMKVDRQHAISLMEGEVETFSDYLEGNVCGFVVEDDDGEHVDSCWGFYGTEGQKEAMSEAKGIVDGLADERDQYNESQAVAMC